MIVEPIKALLRSRKAMVALAFLGAYLITLAIPDVAKYRDGIEVALLVLGSILIGAIAYEDGKEKGALYTIQEAEEAVTSGPKTPAEAGKVLVNEAMDTVLKPPPPPELIPGADG